MIKTGLAFLAVTAILAASLFLSGFSPSPDTAKTQQATEGSITSKLVVVPDLSARVAKFKSVHMPFNSQGLSGREIKMVRKLVDAAGLLDCIYWRQSDPDGLKLYLTLASGTEPEEVLVRRYLKINGSRFDLINNDEPFVGTQPMPLGRGFYGGMTKNDVNALLKADPAAREKIYSPYTIVQTATPTKPSLLTASDFVPYHTAFAKLLSSPVSAPSR